MYPLEQARRIPPSLRSLGAVSWSSIPSVAISKWSECTLALLRTLMSQSRFLYRKLRMYAMTFF